MSVEERFQGQFNLFHHILYSDLDTRFIYWRGVPCQKWPNDLWMYQELLWKLTPDLVIETGTAEGGSALFYASILDGVGGDGAVITVTIEPNLVHQRVREHPRISCLTGSSLDPTIVRMVRERAESSRCVLVSLDGAHERDHVFEELRVYGELVTPGSYVVVEDTNFDSGPHVKDSFGPGPGTAVRDFLARDPRFAADPTCERFLLTIHPGGWLKKLRA